MAHHETDTLGRVFGLQRTAVREGRMAVWNGLVFQRQVDDAVLTGLQAEAATREAAVELATDAVGVGADWLDGALAGDSTGPGPVRRLVERPIDALVDANSAAGETLVEAATAGFDRYEHGLRTVLLAFNRRINVLLAKHEALERRLREYVDGLDDDEKAAQVAEFRRQLSTLQSNLHDMQSRLPDSDAPLAD